VLGLSFIADKTSDQLQLIEERHSAVAIINGAEDPFINHQYLATLKIRNLWGEKVFRIPEARHAPHISASAQFNEILADFLQDLSGS
jgi:pimeloyl-ACP methyl ester carboxylesterase